MMIKWLETEKQISQMSFFNSEGVDFLKSYKMTPNTLMCPYISQEIKKGKDFKAMKCNKNEPSLSKALLCHACDGY